MQKLTGWHKIKHALILVSFRIFSMIPMPVLFLFAELITVVVHYVIGYRKKVIVKNLENSFPQCSQQEIKQITRKYYRHLSAMIIENICLRFITKNQIKKRVIIENPELFEQLKAKNKNIILITGHFGNWEYIAPLPRLMGYKGAAVYKKLSSKAFDKLYYDIRNRLGSQPIEMKESLRKLHALHNAKEPFALTMVADQAPPNRDSNHWMAFLNQDTAIFEGSERFAVKFDMAVVYLETMRIKNGIHKIIPTLITDNPKATHKHFISEKFFELLEESIKKQPHFWLWSHKRWKNKRNKNNANQ